MARNDFPVSQPATKSEPDGTVPVNPVPLAPADGRGHRWRSWLLELAEIGSLAALFIFMLAKSWLRWSDPLMDFPKNLYLAWRISEGDRLYEKVTNWYGPLAHLLEAAGFRLFGVGLDTMVWMNITLTVAVALLLRAIFRQLGNRLTGWLATLAFIQVFAFGRYMESANYNFLAPYTSPATYSFLGLVLVLWALLRHLQSDRPICLAVAGLGFGIAYLDKPEAILAAAGALAVYFTTRSIRLARQPALSGGRHPVISWTIKSIVWLVGGFLCAWLPVLLFFWSEGGPGYALRATNYVPLSLLDSSVRHAIGNSPMLLGFLGLDHPWPNFLRQAAAGGILLLVCGVMVFTFWRATQSRQFGAKWWMWVAALLAAVITGSLISHAADQWQLVGRAIAFPVFLATAGAVAWSVRSAWRGSPSFPRAVALAVVGAAASLILARMVLNTTINHYGFFMMPLAALFWIHLLAGEAPRALASAARKNWLLPTAFSLLVFSGVLELTRRELSIYADQSVAFGSGRVRLYAMPLRISPSGLLFDAMVTAVKEKTPGAQSLVAFPEGIAINYHLRVPSPLAEQEFHPLALAFAGPDHVFAELQAHPPEAIFVFVRNYDEFGDQYFGQSHASGRNLLQWILQNYRLLAKGGRTANTFTQDAIDLYVPNPPSTSPPASSATPPITPPPKE